MIVRLNVGKLEESEEGTTRDPKGNWIEKSVKMVYAGKFKSMDGDVEIKDEDIEKLISNHNSLRSRLKRLASGEIPITSHPPIQLDHSTSATMTVGRLVGDFKEGIHEDELGGKHKALFSRMRIMGKENVERVEDGRWADVSIGADLESHKMTELSITPFPAAQGATMLAKLHKDSKYKDHDVRIYQDTNTGKYRWETTYSSGEADSESAALSAAHTCIDEMHKRNPQMRKLSQGDELMGYKELKEKAALYEKCRKHLTDNKKMSEEEADKHLEAAKDEELTAMAAENDEHLKHLAEEDAKKKEEDEKKKSELSSQRDGLVKLAGRFKETSKKVQLAEKASKIHVRLSTLRAAAKISPAEMKTINIDELASKSDEVVEAALSSYEKRQPVIDTGLIGSTKAMSPSQLAGALKRMNMEKEELQTRLNMPLKREAALKRLSEIEKEEKHLGDQEVHAAHMADDKDDEKHLESALAQFKKLTDEGKHDEAKEHLKSYMKGKHMTEAHIPDPTPHMSALAAELKSMHNDFVEYVKLTAPAFGAKVEELI